MEDFLNEGEINFRRNQKTGELDISVHVEIPKHEKIKVGSANWIFREDYHIITPSKNVSEHAEYSEAFRAISEIFGKWAKMINRIEFGK